MSQNRTKEYKERIPKIQLYSENFVIDYCNYILNNKEGTIEKTKFQETDNCSTLRMESEALDFNLQATLEIETTGEKDQ